MRFSGPTSGQLFCCLVSLMAGCFSTAADRHVLHPFLDGSQSLFYLNKMKSGFSGKQSTGRKASTFKILFISQCMATHSDFLVHCIVGASHYENADVDWTRLLDFQGVQATHSPLGNLAALLSSAPLPLSNKNKANQQLRLYAPSNKTSSLLS